MSLAKRAIELAAELQRRGSHLQTRAERREREKIVRMIDDPMGISFTTAFADSCFRSPDTHRTADQIAYLIDSQGVPPFLPAPERAALRLFHRMGERLHERIVPVARKMIRREMRHVILPGEGRAITRHTHKREVAGIEINLNRLGEQILSQREAKERLDLNIQDLSRDDVDYISVKVSSICDHLNLVARDDTLGRLRSALRPLYEIALEHNKFVNLDMEGYSDLHLTIDLFCSLLDEPAFHDLSAGIVLQAYIPESYPLLQQLTHWATRRDGAPIKVRIVKGANLGLERVEASIMGWPRAPYESKEEADANFKQMVDWALRPEHARYVKVGIGSHNLFDIAYAHLLSQERSVEEALVFEMLEGMAPSTGRAVKEMSDRLLLYCPVAEERDFQVAIAYLIRRLDEQAAPQNFLRQSFGADVESPQWRIEASRFEESLAKVGEISNLPRRSQNRFEAPLSLALDQPFQNESDTDWSLPHHSRWAHHILERARTFRGHHIPLVIGGEELEGAPAIGVDPSEPARPLYHYSLASSAQIDQALSCAKRSDWGTAPLEQRLSTLSKVAQELRKARADLIAAMVTDTGKIIKEGDKELSEAVDFVEYYIRSMGELLDLDGVSFSPKGTYLVLSPWNFPCAIPTGGIAAALAAGNTVLFKPAPESVLVGWLLANCFWAAGVPKDALQFVTCADEPTGSQLVQDPRVDGVILTGATATAAHLLHLRPGLDLCAETGGKNSLIISDLSDHDLAIRDLLQSAFGHSGQKCSAASLAILMEPLYKSRHFLERLRDGAKSMQVGSAWDLSTEISPLIAPPKGALLRGLTRLEEGEEWLLEPSPTENPHLWTPGIKLGSRPGGFTHQTELFGPVLALLSAANLPQATELANQTPYGLTAGIHSLDPREIQRWTQQIDSGNLYINRTITGAIVQRQPFGGTKMSSFGGGLKAGGPSYLTQLQTAHTTALPTLRGSISYRLHALEQWATSSPLSDEQRQLLVASLESYSYWEPRLSCAVDVQQLIGQENELRYIPHRFTLLRLQKGDAPLDLARICAAAITARTHLEVSWDPKEMPGVPSTWPVGVSISLESNEECARRIRERSIRRIRLASAPSKEIVDAAAVAGSFICDAPVCANGRIELLHYMREVATSYDYHRYGNTEIYR